MRKDYIEYVKTCEEYQRFDNISQLLAEELQSTIALWPFATRGVDILRPFSLSKGQVKFLLAHIDHFTKWIEVEPMTTISVANVQKFIWKNIICRFEIPNTQIFDNGKWFIEKGVEEFLANLGIKHRATLVEHPQSNGQIEAANKVILA